MNWFLSSIKPSWQHLELMYRELTNSQVKKGRLMGELRVHAHAHCVQIAVCRWESSRRLTGREGLCLESDVNHTNHGSPDLLLILYRECCLD